MASRPGRRRARRRPGAWTLGIGLAVAACGTGRTSPADGAPDADPTEGVARAIDRYLSAVSDRDSATVAGSYVADDRFAWIEDGAVRYRSAEQVWAGLQGFPPDLPIRTELTGLTVVPVGDRAAHAWTGFATTVGEGPGSFSFGGQMSFVLERSGDEWRIVGGHTSSPRPGRTDPGR